MGRREEKLKKLTLSPLLGGSSLGGPLGARSIWGAFQQPLTVILVQKHCDINGNRVVIHMGGVYTTSNQGKGTLL